VKGEASWWPGVREARSVGWGSSDASGRPPYIITVIQLALSSLA
jgi:hypothetical protein